MKYPSEKRCFKCLIVKPLSGFYQHKSMADGHLGKCKLCTRSDVSVHRADNVESIRQYDRQRAKLPHRVEDRASRLRAMRSAGDIRVQARDAVGRAIRDGRLKRMPCQECGDPKSEAHHPDYSKPLDVEWLCKLHHEAVHHAMADKYPLAVNLAA